MKQHFVDKCLAMDGEESSQDDEHLIRSEANMEKEQTDPESELCKSGDTEKVGKEEIEPCNAGKEVGSAAVEKPIQPNHDGAKIIVPKETLPSENAVEIQPGWEDTDMNEEVIPDSDCRQNIEGNVKKVVETKKDLIERTETSTIHKEECQHFKGSEMAFDEKFDRKYEKSLSSVESSEGIDKNTNEFIVLVTATPKQTEQVTETTRPAEQVAEILQLTRQVGKIPELTKQITETQKPIEQVKETCKPTEQVTEKFELTERVTGISEPTEQVAEISRLNEHSTETPVPIEQVTEMFQVTDQVADMPELTEQTEETLQTTEQVTVTSKPTEQRATKPKQLKHVKEMPIPTNQMTKVLEQTDPAIKITITSEHVGERLELNEKVPEVPEATNVITEESGSSQQVTETIEVVAETPGSAEQSKGTPETGQEDEAPESMKERIETPKAEQFLQILDTHAENEETKDFKDFVLGCTV